MSTIKEVFAQTEYNQVLRNRIVKAIDEAISEALWQLQPTATGHVSATGDLFFNESIDEDLLQEVKEAANGAAGAAYKEHIEDPYTYEDEFDPEAVKDAFIELLNEGVHIDHDGHEYGEFIQNHAHLFPNLDTSHEDAMHHAARLCKTTFDQYQSEIQEFFDALNA